MIPKPHRAEAIKVLTVSTEHMEETITAPIEQKTAPDQVTGK